MFLFTLIDNTQLVDYIMKIAIGLIIVICVIFLAAKKDNWNSKVIVYAAMSIGLSFALSFIQLKMSYGGSITLASFVPIILFSYFYGFKKGLIVGLIYSFLQFIQDPYYLNIWQFLFDFIFAFSSVCLASVFKKFMPQLSSLILGTILVGIVRLAMHTCAGIIFFNMGWVVPLPIFGELNAAFVYSLCYNALYMVPDVIICIAVLFYLYKSKTLDRLFANFSK